MPQSPRLRNDLKCVEWDVEPCSTHNTRDLAGYRVLPAEKPHQVTTQSPRQHRSAERASAPRFSYARIQCIDTCRCRCPVGAWTSRSAVTRWNRRADVVAYKDRKDSQVQHSWRIASFSDSRWLCIPVYQAVVYTRTVVRYSLTVRYCYFCR